MAATVPAHGLLMRVCRLLARNPWPSGLALTFLLLSFVDRARGGFTHSRNESALPLPGKLKVWVGALLDRVGDRSTYQNPTVPALLTCLGVMAFFTLKNNRSPKEQRTTRVADVLGTGKYCYMK